MAYIVPNTTIKLLSNVPIDKTQADTLWFYDKASQTAYFNSKVRRTYTAQSYQRKDRGYIRLFNANDIETGVKYEDIFDCNYLMYQNTSYGNRWFYAFINSIDYINDSVCEVRYTIDPIQTWFFDYSLHQCFVERCTPSSDEIGENILPEKIEVGEYVMNGQYEYLGNRLTEKAVIFMYVNPDSTSEGGGSAYEGANYGGVYGAAELWIFDPQNTTAIQTWIDARKQHLDSIVGAYMIPKWCYSGEYGTRILTNNIGGLDGSITGTGISKTTPLHDYVPRNKKLYTYPYTYYQADAGSGQTLTLRYEFFENLTPSFQMSANLTYPVEVVLFPKNYKNIPSYGGDMYHVNRTLKLALKGFPMCSWSSDAFNAWLAQNSVPLLLGAVATGVGVLGGAALVAGTGGLAAIPMAAGVAGGAFSAGELAATKAATGQALGVAGRAAGSAIGALTEGYKASIAADVTGGSFMTGSCDYAFNRMNFKGGMMTQPLDYLKAMDKYFDMYGYAMNQHRLVNTHVRTRWTYVKTRGCTVEGNLPADDADYICACYDNGIRFWSDTTNPLNYTAGDNDFL